jgi:PAS domain S-box-containing protein
MRAARARRLDLVMEASGLGDWSWDAEADLITLSPRAAALFGLKEGLRLSWEDFKARLAPDDQDRAQAAVDAALRGEPCEFECRSLHEDGAEGWVLARGRALMNEAGETVAMMGVVSDITRAKVMEAQLRESEARFRAMAEAAPSPVWVTTAAGPIEFVNQAFAEFAGRPAETLLGDAWIGLIHPDDLQGVGRIREAARRGLEAYTFEARFKGANGGWRMMHASSKPRFDETGTFCGYVGMAVDVTDMRAAEQAARESERRFRLVADDAPVMLWMCDETGKMLYLNRRLREFWGVGEEMEAFDWAMTPVPDDRLALRTIFRAAMARIKAFESEGRYPRADGEVRTLFTRAVPRIEPDGRFVGMVGVNVDVTEVRRSEGHQKLLINELNHRVKNTLATVQSVVRQTVRGEASPAELRTTLTSRLLALSAAHDVLTKENWEGAGLREVVDQAIRHYEPAGAPRFIVSGAPVRLPPKTALAMSMALHELATNAVKHGALSCETGRVEISWSTDAAGSPILMLDWREVGGPPVAKPVSAGFGSRLLRQGMAIELGWPAELDFAPEGLTATLKARLD